MLAALSRHLTQRCPSSAPIADGTSTCAPPPSRAHRPDEQWRLAAHAAAVAALHGIRIFDMDASCVRNFSREQFDRDGYYLWPGLLTAQGREQVQAACERVQALQDERWLDADWQSVAPSQWHARGWCTPRRFLTADEKERCRGGSQLGGAPPAEPLPDPVLPGDPATPRLYPVLQGFTPESFPAGYDGAMMGLLTHPQMLQIQRMLLGPRPLHDHNTMLSRKEGFSGQHWHSHPYTHDNAGPSVLLPKFTLVRNLVYPGGFGATDDGGIKLVPGGHLHRDAVLHPPAVDDEALEAGWLRGRTHPRTGEPLRIFRPSLPPASMVSVRPTLLHAAAFLHKAVQGSQLTSSHVWLRVPRALCVCALPAWCKVHTHIPHAVAARRSAHGTRWCVTFNFASADESGA